MASMPYPCPRTRLICNWPSGPFSRVVFHLSCRMWSDPACFQKPLNFSVLSCPQSTQSSYSGAWPKPLLMAELVLIHTGPLGGFQVDPQMLGECP